MASPATETWWSSFLDAQGRDSEEEAAFTGYLTTQGIPAWSGPDELQSAYAAFRTFMQESYDREADRGPDRATLAAERAVAELEQQFVAKSRVSAPGVEKPLTAATRPAESRKPLAESAPGPGGAAQVAPAEGEQPPTHPAVHDSAEGAMRPDIPTPSPTQSDPDPHPGRSGRRGGSSGND